MFFFFFCVFLFSCATTSLGFPFLIFIQINKQKCEPKKLTEIVELNLTQWSTSNPSLNAAIGMSNISGAGISTGSVTSAGSAIGSIHLTNVQVHGNAPTASPEFSGLTPTNTGSSGMSNNQSVSGGTTKREPYLQKWFMSTSSSSPHSAANAQNSNADNSMSVQASPAASSLAAMSVDSNESMQQNSSITTNTSKKITTNGEHSSHKSKSFFNSHNNNAADISIKSEQQIKSTTQQQKQQKSSRRTTSLLNLFMSNSQGNKYNRHNNNKKKNDFQTKLVDEFNITYIFYRSIHTVTLDNFFLFK